MYEALQKLLNKERISYINVLLILLLTDSHTKHLDRQPEKEAERHTSALRVD